MVIINRMSSHVVAMTRIQESLLCQGVVEGGGADSIVSLVYVLCVPETGGVRCCFDRKQPICTFYSSWEAFDRSWEMGGKIKTPPFQGLPSSLGGWTTQNKTERSTWGRWISSVFQRPLSTLVRQGLESSEKRWMVPMAGKELRAGSRTMWCVLLPHPQ